MCIFSHRCVTVLFRIMILYGRDLGMVSQFWSSVEDVVVVRVREKKQSVGPGNHRPTGRYCHALHFYVVENEYFLV
jgi:hypothetical protein